MMLHAVPLKNPGAAIIHMDGQRHGHGTLRKHQSVAFVFIDVQVIGDDLELITGHSKNVVVVNVHQENEAWNAPATDSGGIWP